MTGKIVYMAIVEKDVKIPDEIIEISEKSWYDRTEEEDKRLRVFSKNAWDTIENYFNCIGIYYSKDGKNWTLEED